MMTRATPLFEPADDGAHVAHAAAELHFHLHRCQDAFDRRRVHRLPGEGAVEIDDVQIAKTLLLEPLGLRGRVGVEDGCLRHVAAHEADAFAVLQVDRGKEYHGRHFRKLAISARPRVWLFSGEIAFR